MSYGNDTKRTFRVSTALDHKVERCGAIFGVGRSEAWRDAGELYALTGALRALRGEAPGHDGNLDGHSREAASIRRQLEELCERMFTRPDVAELVAAVDESASKLPRRQRGTASENRATG